MAYKHQLSLEVPETNNCSLFRVIDTSIYSDEVPVTCPRLEITAPGYNQSESIDGIAPGFNLILNACALKIQTIDCQETSQVLPDGAYTIKYSVSPNDKVFVEYHYLRVCQVLNSYYNELCKLELAACEPQADIKAQLEELRMIKNYIDAAKVKVEICDELEEGKNLLEYAKKQLVKISGHC